MDLIRFGKLNISNGDLTLIVSLVSCRIPCSINYICSGFAVRVWDCVLL